MYVSSDGTAVDESEGENNRARGERVGAAVISRCHSLPLVAFTRENLRRKPLHVS